jgi:hypothetical protein
MSQANTCLTLPLLDQDSKTFTLLLDEKFYTSCCLLGTKPCDWDKDYIKVKFLKNTQPRLITMLSNFV